MKKNISLQQLQNVDSDAYRLALDILQTSCFDDDDAPPGEDEFSVWLDSAGRPNMLVWDNYAPFHPLPSWAWDSVARTWIDPENSVNDLALFEKLTREE